MSVFAIQDAVFRRFYTKSKHGHVIVRSMNLGGPPFFGANDDSGVWALYRTPPGEDPTLGGQLAAVGFRASPELVERLVTACTVLSDGVIHLAGLIRGGIEQRAI